MRGILFGAINIAKRLEFDHHHDMWSLIRIYTVFTYPLIASAILECYETDLVIFLRFIQFSNAPSELEGELTSSKYRWLFVIDFSGSINEYSS